MLGFNELGSKGWLGNQMFQYAGLMGIAAGSGHYAVIPPSDGTQAHDYGLWENFQMSHAIPGYVDGPVLSVNFGFHRNLISDCPDNVNISGFLQSEKYFLHIEDRIRKDFTFKKSFFIPGDKYVAVHVRRGDYLNVPLHHPVQEKEYYEKAISEIAHPGPILVFSDDPSWCKQNIRADWYSDGSDKISDLFLMSHAEHNIISNSSFGWWGAWLNANKDKVVVAPSRWFGPALGSLDTSDVIPDGWVTL